MTRWHRQIPLDADAELRDEVWTHTAEDGSTAELTVRVKLGKPIEILKLKQDMLENFSKLADKTRSTRQGLFGDTSAVTMLEQCPVCGCEDHAAELSFYGAHYHACSGCGHHFVANRPSPEAIAEFYRDSDTYQNTYADRKTADIRIEQVVMPKAAWTIETFERIHGRKPESILDVGAGCGHFVEACRQLGLRADGLEISNAGRDVCKEMFGFEMFADDFIATAAKWSNYDVITFWGVIEHVPAPPAMLEAAATALAGRDGLIVAEVPRWNCLGTAVQGAYAETVFRHLEPLGHINCFTDSSLATAFRNASIDVVGAWYFGMDAFELAMQLSHELGDERIIEELGRMLPALQQRIDLAMLSDEMVFAGLPQRT